MKPILLVAFSAEINPLVQFFHLDVPQTYGHTKIWHGDLFTLVRTGIGKVNAAATTQLLIERDHPQTLINVGVVGGFAAKTTIGDVVIPKDVIQYDIDQRSLGFRLGQLPESTIVSVRLSRPKKKINGIISGRCLTGDAIVSDKKLAHELEETFNPTIVDMELGAIAQVCRYYNVPLFAVKGVVDIVEKEEVSTFEQRISLCMSNIFPVIGKIIASLS